MLSSNLSSIEINRLEKRFADDAPAAVAGVSTSIEKGKITGLVGPDGAGKTTLMRLMAGLLQPSSGSLSVEGLNPAKDGEKLRHLIGYMPQKFGLYEDLSVFENLQLYADLRNVVGDERKKSFERLLAFTDLTHFTTRYAGKLSGGMKQKLGLACTLLGKPKVLLLDEPSVGVDPISRRELWKMVGELAQDGMTVVWSTSYLDEAELCDEVRLMNQGHFTASGTPAMLIDSMAGRTLHLCGIKNNRREVLRQALNVPEVMDGVIQGSNIRLVLREADKQPSLDLLKAGEGASLIQTQPRLEDAFISLLGGGPGGNSVLANVMPEVVLDKGVAPDAVIKAHELTKKFGDFVATDHVNFSVAKGEIFGLLGPNGAGKSTTFKMMCGLLVPTSGEAHVMGIDLKTSASQARQRLGYMAQKFSLYAGLTVQQNLEFFSGVYGLRGEQQKAKIQQMKEVFALETYKNTVTGDLPLGFKQRLALACSVMHEPQLLFLDEPTSGVDPVTRREFWNHINGLTRKGVTIMVTTHFMDEAEYCDRIALVYQGKIIAAGTPDALKQKVATTERPDPSMEDAFVDLVEGAEI